MPTRGMIWHEIMVLLILADDVGPVGGDVTLAIGGGARIVGNDAQMGGDALAADGDL